MKKYLKMLPVLALVTGLSSCLKDKPIIADKPQNIVEFYTTEGYLSSATAVYPVYGKSFVIGEDASFDVIVSYSGTETAPQDITVEVAVDPAALTKYNTKAAVDGDQEYGQLQTNVFSIQSGTVVIKKGERRATLKVKVKIPADFDFDGSYALPLTIKKASTGTISGNFGSVLYAIGGKNQYEGVYHSTGVRVHPSLGPFPFDTDVTMNTAGSKGISGDALADLGPNLKIIVNADNSVSLSSTAQPSVALTPGGVNKYDPATKTFTLTYFYNTGAPRKITQTLVKK
ncbi:hypothetical protein ABIB62_000429 [Mucilaginibacter sp. UYP25]|uniref:BT_3987 domain-containing protein n=1 Tax=unclassified Mucilaginibacter TaxID=2617802 RepID=UPI0033940678